MDKLPEKRIREFLDLASSLAISAGKIQLDRIGNAGKITYKGNINLVTEVDIKCEKEIVDGLASSFPDHDILGEEGVGKRRESDFRWIVDPLDGTVNFAHQFPFFGVSIGLEYKGTMVCGVVYAPIRDELFRAGKGMGTTLNGSPVKVSDNKKLKESLLATGFAYNVQDHGVPDNLDHFKNFLKTALAVRRPGAAAVDLAYVACGRLDGFWELFLKPWDMAAGIILIQEAGGRVSTFDGSEFDLYGSEVLVSNSKIHEEMIFVLHSR